MTTPDQRRRSGLRSWFDRGGWVDAWHAAYLLTLAVATGVAAADGTLAAGERLRIVAVAAALGAWYLLIARRWRYWEASPARFVVFLLVAAALWVPLLRWHPAFAPTAWAAYGVAACPWLRRAIPTVGALTVLLAAVDHTDGTPLRWSEAAGLLAVAAVVLLAHATLGALSRESERRRLLIAELESTRADLAQREREAGMLEERQRLAREIHDGLAQSFASIVTLLEAADARLPPAAIDARAAVDQARQAARDSLAESRRLVWALRPEQADGPSALAADLDRLATRTRAAGRVAVDVVVTGRPTGLAPAAELAILRTAQEAVANATRHAAATTITITLSWLGDHVILDVADDGRGFDRTAASASRASRGPGGGGFGLVSLRERAAACGATLEVDSRRGEGTTVSLRVPAHDPAGPGAEGRDR